MIYRCNCWEFSMSALQKQVGALVRRRRMDRNLTQSELATKTGRSDPSVLRTVDDRIREPESQPFRRQHDPAGKSVATQFHIGDLKPAERLKATEIQKILVAAEREGSGPPAPPKGLAQRDCPRTHVLRGYVNLTPNARACHARHVRLMP